MTDACRLLPRSQVRVQADKLLAESTEPWLDATGVDWASFGGSFVELMYRACLFDIPARPVFRFHLADGRTSDRIGPAPVLGAAIWIGRVPAGTVGLSISPTNHRGVFGFAIERVHQRSWPSLLADGLRHRPRQTRSSVLTRLIGWAPESDNNLDWAIAATDVSAYCRWSRRRSRNLDRAGLDKPRHDWSRSPEILLVVHGMNETLAMTRTLTSLRAQAFPNWIAVLVDGPTHVMKADARIRSVSLREALDHLGTLPDDVLVGVLKVGDVLPSYACALLAEQRSRQPVARVFYGDEVAAGMAVFKPGWSPRLQASRPYLGRAVFVRGVAAWTIEERRGFVVDGALPDSIAAAGSDLVKPLRRVLLETPDAPSMAKVMPLAPPPRPARAAIIILTRDHPALLRRVVASIRAKSTEGSFRLVIVDNGEPEGPAKDLLAQLTTAPDVLLLHRRETFNFSLFCNDAVAACDEEFVVFLNDDTEVLSDGWLDRLSALAFDPHVGAVGAKLTLPDGRLQHVGVLVGMGGSAGHLGSLAPGDDPGWAGRNTVAHDVSAVTGACLAVTRAKFEAVGGFDAEHLPIELSDIDLCLKLNARGWQTVVDPAVHLTHEESASRGGATFRRLDVYGQQREVFIERWRHVLRDDPAFHPGLSLYSLRAALG